ncbi:MAG: PilZ domain-containing protein [Pseudomonadota bacterium]
MSQKPHVAVKDIVNDIRSGVPDHELMRKYNLSVKGVQRAFEKLVLIGAVTRAEIDARGQAAADTIFFQSMRELPRHYLVVQIPIHVIGDNSKTVGKVRDITEQGLGISGVEATVGEEKTFGFYPDEFISVQPFTFKAECRWAEQKGPKDFVAGFQITNITKDGLEKLRQLIQDLTFGDG